MLLWRHQLVLQRDKRMRLLVASAIATAWVVCSAQTARSNQSPDDFYVRDDRGGYVALYAIKVKQLIRSDRQVRFVGRCDSACTLYLAIPETRACVVENAVFGFHLPHGGNPKANEAVAQMMLSSYPNWVRDWISDHGGLTQHLKSMGYDYARQFLPDCRTL